MEILLKGFQCQRCGYAWKPRKKGRPKKCPHCDSPNWQIPQGERMPPHLEEVFQLYEVPQDQRAEIIAYARHYPGMAKALRDAVPHLEKVFGKTRRRRLDLFKYLDNPGEEQLLGLVLFKKYPENAFDLLEQFDAAFFSNVPREVNFHLGFDVGVEDDYSI